MALEMLGVPGTMTGSRVYTGSHVGAERPNNLYFG